MLKKLFNLINSDRLDPTRHFVRAIVLAHREATRRQLPYVESLLLLYAVLKVDPEIIQPLLPVGMTVRSLQQTVDDKINQTLVPNPLRSSKGIPQRSDEVRWLLDRAEKEAIELQDEKRGLEHLFLALTQKGSASAILQAFGVNPVNVRGILGHPRVS